MEKDNIPWQQMSVLRLLFTLAGAAAFMAALVYITSSSAPNLWALILSVPIAFIAFCIVIPFGTMTTLLVVFTAEILMFFVQRETTKEHVFLCLRWIAFLAGMGALLWIGGRGAYDGLINNRLVDVQVLYERCMTNHKFAPFKIDGRSAQTAGTRLPLENTGRAPIMAVLSRA